MTALPRSLWRRLACLLIASLVLQLAAPVLVYPAQSPVAAQAMGQESLSPTLTSTPLGTTTLPLTPTLPLTTSDLRSEQAALGVSQGERGNAPLTPTLSLTPMLPLTTSDLRPEQAALGVSQGERESAALTATVPAVPPSAEPGRHLALWLRAEPEGVVPGELLTLTLGVSNTGGVPLSELVLSATLPAGLHRVSGQPGWDYAASEKQLRASLGELAAGAGLTSSLLLRALGPVDELVLQVLALQVLLDLLGRRLPDIHVGLPFQVLRQNLGMFSHCPPPGAVGLCPVA